MLLPPLEIMDLYRFLSTSLPTINENTCIHVVMDNSHPHLDCFTVASLSRGNANMIRVLPNRWDSSLSAREALELCLDSPKRSVDHAKESMPCTPVTPSDNTAALSQIRVNRDSHHNHCLDSSSGTRFDMTWAHQFFPPTREIASSEPPRMPHRHAEYFPEVEDREQ